MRTVLLVGVAHTLRNYIAKKLHDIGIYAFYAKDFNLALEYMKKTKVLLIILEHNTNQEVLFDFFEKKKLLQGVAELPTIMLTNSISKVDTEILTLYNVKKVLSKPVRVDELFTAMGRFGGFKFDVDKTPCILEMRVNENVIFIELAQGLNKDKLELLQFRLTELINLYNLASPKVLVMMSDLDLNQSDALDLQFLVDNILAVKAIEQMNVKFLTMNSFINNFFRQRSNYHGIQVVSSLRDALADLLSDDIVDEDAAAENILQHDHSEENNFGNLAMRFRGDSPSNLTIAVVDDDPVVYKIMETVFDDKADVVGFSDGNSFLSKFDDTAYDIVFLDMLMPGKNGIDVLMEIRKRGGKTPFVILSSVTHRDVIVKALEKGAKRYILKPISRDIILKKTKEVLGAIF